MDACRGHSRFFSRFCIHEEGGSKQPDFIRVGSLSRNLEKRFEDLSIKIYRSYFQDVSVSSLVLRNNCGINGSGLLTNEGRDVITRVEYFSSEAKLGERKGEKKRKKTIFPIR